MIDEGTIVVWAFDTFDQAGIATHAHREHQLAWASAGALTVGIDHAHWVLPRSRALWIPAGTPHDVRPANGAAMISLYFEPSDAPAGFDKPVVVDTAGLLGSLMRHLSSHVEPEARRRAEAVVFDLLEPVEVTSLSVPVPEDDRGRRVAEMLRCDPSDQRTMAEFGQAVGASARTLARVIEHETGLGFAEWRRMIRIAAALPYLANGASVASVAQRVGYETPSAFVAAFRRATGTTPGRYFQ